MSLLNNPGCGVNVKNTGKGNCPVDIGYILGNIKVPTTFALTDTDMQSESAILTKLQTALSLGKSTRIYPFPDFLENTDGTSAPTKGTYGYGGEYYGRDPNVSWSFGIRGLDYLAKAQSFKNSGYLDLFYDETGLLFGTKTSDGTGMKGIPSESYNAYLAKIADGSKPTDCRIDYSFQPSYITTGLAYVQLNLSDLLNVQGLRDVNLKITSRNLNVIDVTLYTGNTNLGDLYPVELASPANFIVTDAITGKTITVTSVTYAAPNFILTLDTTDPDYVPANKLTVTAINAAGLSTLLKTGYEVLAPATTLA